MSAIGLLFYFAVKKLLIKILIIFDYIHTRIPVMVIHISSKFEMNWYGNKYVDLIFNSLIMIILPVSSTKKGTVGT